jgi:hypothetical protein
MEHPMTIWAAAHIHLVRLKLTVMPEKLSAFPSKFGSLYV